MDNTAKILAVILVIIIVAIIIYAIASFTSPVPTGSFTQLPRAPSSSIGGGLPSGSIGGGCGI